MIQVSDLSKNYGETVALDGATFSVNKGSITGFLGPNGAGKTTALRILTGFLMQDGGSVMFEKKKLDAHYEELINSIGYLPENNPLYENMRVDEFLIFFAKMKDAFNQEKLSKIAKRSGIDDVLTKPIETLSKGYRQRVGLAKALIGDPEYLLLDEPTTGLDPNQKEEILKLIKSYAKERTVLFSSHVLSEVSQIADKVIIINEGKIVAEGSSEDLVKEHFKNSIITVKTDAPLLKLRKALQKSKNIISIEKVTEGRPNYQEYEIESSESEEVSSIQVFEEVVKNKWKLTELHGKSQGLEELFKQLTKS